MVNITMLVANRPRLTKQALDSIGDLSDATVTIRDAGMNEEVRDIVRQWVASGHAHAHLFASQVPVGTGPARNEVIRSSESVFGRGDYLYISDDDVSFTRPDWLALLIDAYEQAWESGYRVLAAYNHPYNQPVSWFKYSISKPLPYGAMTPGVDFSTTGTIELGLVYEVYAVATQSMLMRWSVFDEFGPFCDTPAGKVCQSEDVAFCNKIREAGYKVGVVSPALLVNCGITNSFGEKIPGWEAVLKERIPGVYVE